MSVWFFKRLSKTLGLLAVVLLVGVGSVALGASLGVAPSSHVAAASINNFVAQRLAQAEGAQLTALLELPDASQQQRQPRANAGEERILRMDVTAELSEDAGLVITERIVFFAAGKDIKRGLVRVLPLSWERPDGANTLLFYRDIQIFRDGRAESWRQEKAGSNLEIFIGSSSHLLEPGVHEYIISYGLDNAILRKDGKDSLYLNVTGNDWAFTIEQASFMLILPDAVAGRRDERILEREVYTGLHGKRGHDAQFTSSGGAVTTQAITSGAGMTVFYAWPTEITSWIQVKELRGGLAHALIPSRDSIVVFAPSLLLCLLYVFFALRWSKAKAGAIIPIFDPPAGFLPGNAYYIIKKRYGSSAFAADLLYLMHKGLLFQVKIDDNGQKRDALSRYPEPGNPESLAAEKLKPAHEAQQLPPGGEQFYEALFASGKADAVALNETKYYTAMRRSGDVRIANSAALQLSMRQLGRNRKEQDAKSFFPKTALLILSLICWFAFTLFMWGKLSGEVLVLNFIGSLIIFLVFVFMFVLPTVISYRNILRGNWNIISFKNVLRVAVLVWFMAVVVFVLQKSGAFGLLLEMFKEIFGIGVVWGGLAPAGVLSSFAAGLAAFVVACIYLPARTHSGELRFNTAKGIELYLKTAEEHRFAVLYPQEENVQHFEELLPYALALGVGKTWANSFEKYCEQAGLGDLAQTGRSYAAAQIGISRSIASGSERSAPSSGSSSSGSRSSSRGGSSGGGAGGGGGRGW